MKERLNPRSGSPARGAPIGVAAVFVTALATAFLSAGCVSGRDDARELYGEALLEDAAPSLPKDESPREAVRRIEAESARLEEAAALTLSDCFKLALARSEELQAKGEDLLIASELEREAVGNLLPKVSLDWQYTRDSDVVRFGGSEIQPRDTSEYWIAVRQPLFDARLLASLTASGEVSRIERLSLKDSRDRLLYAVAAAFYDVLAIEKDIQALRANESFAREQVRVLQVRHEEGEAVLETVEAARAFLGEALSMLAGAQNDMEASQGRLRRLIGLELLPGELVDNYEMTYSPGLIPDLAQRAWRTRNDAEAARAAVNLAERERLHRAHRLDPERDGILAALRFRLAGRRLLARPGDRSQEGARAHLAQAPGPAGGGGGGARLPFPGRGRGRPGRQGHCRAGRAR